LRRGKALPDPARIGLARSGKARLHTLHSFLSAEVRRDMTRRGMAWLGSAQHGTAPITVQSGGSFPKKQLKRNNL
jgi:hypothetical protein